MKVKVGLTFSNNGYATQILKCVVQTGVT